MVQKDEPFRSGYRGFKSLYGGIADGNYGSLNTHNNKGNAGDGNKGQNAGLEHLLKMIGPTIQSNAMSLFFQCIA